ncbi:carboxypeptidase-like regulatory domain-containing protein, partial [bacterium]|nr:carboxypeptidase-like regulatory domain-containing protein [bacterium]
MQKLSLIILWLLFTLNLVAQKDYKQTIRGTVVDKYTQMPLIGATVILLESEPLNGTATDEQGNFRLEHIPVGRQGIKVSYIGYYPMSINNLLLSSGKELVLNIELEERVFVSKEVVIKFHHKKNKPINEMAVISARSFTVEETERYAGSWGDPARMVANFAGVMSVSDQQNEIIIRGNSPTGLLWRLDGIDIPNPNHFGSTGTTGGPVCMLNNNLLTNSDFFTGAFPAEYGNVLAGVFDLKMRTGNNEKREYMSQIGFNGFELGAEGPFSNKNKSSYLVNIRYATLEGFEALGMDIGTGSSMPQFKDISFKIDIPGTKYGRFSLFGLGGKSFIQLHDSKKDSTEWSYGLSGTDTDYGTDMGVTGLSHLFFLNEKTRLK